MLLAVQLLYGVVVSAQSYFFPIYVKESLGMATIVVSTFVSLRQISGFATALIGGTLVVAVAFFREASEAPGAGSTASRPLDCGSGPQS
jgi:hypothetical protein